MKNSIAMNHNHHARIGGGMIVWPEFTRFRTPLLAKCVIGFAAGNWSINPG